MKNLILMFTLLTLTNVHATNQCKSDYWECTDACKDVTTETYELMACADVCAAGAYLCFMDAKISKQEIELKTDRREKRRTQSY